MESSNPEPKIMVVDDAMTNLQAAKNALFDVGVILTVPSAQRMFELLETITIDLILLDINMPEINGLEAIKVLKDSPRHRDIPVIILTANADVSSELKCLDLGAVDYIVKPFNPKHLSTRVKLHLTLASQRRQIEDQNKLISDFSVNLRRMVSKEVNKVAKINGVIAEIMLDIAESREILEDDHVARTMDCLKILLVGLDEVGIYREEIENWRVDVFLHASLLHDLGKICVSDNCLKKPGQLTVKEFEEIKRHTFFGVSIIDRISKRLQDQGGDFIHHARLLALTHHEWWDGSGYPQGLKGFEIPLQGRLMAIVDVFDALISRRPYRPPFNAQNAINTIVERAGSQFDPNLIEVFKNKVMSFVSLL
ncbi:MAG: response regulator [Deltaproteobacteria bacterium]|jgi:putative two-component system response regulator|nr:response regulator [Deltaproteobacteria bacterium]